MFWGTEQHFIAYRQFCNRNSVTLVSGLLYGYISVLYICCINFVVFLVGIFPEPDKDPVIQIANMVIRQGEKDPFIRNVFTWKSCAPIVGAEVLSFDTEQELLRVSWLTVVSLSWM